jgi:hypothetical protein
MVGVKRRDKKGSSNVVFPPVIFLVLNLAFIALLLVFIFRSSGGGLVYEQAYAKEIALLIDEASSGMEIFVNIDKGLELAEKNGKDKNRIVSVDSSESKVIVDLFGKGGYSYKYFSDYRVDASFDSSKNMIKLVVSDKNE